MLESGIKARRQISRWIASHSDLPPFIEEDWGFLQQLSLVLQRFHEHTEHVSQSAPQISYAVPVYYDLHDLMHDASAREGDFRTLHDEISTTVSSALTRYAKYYDFMDGLDIYCVALILNPRYKTRLLKQELGDDATLIIQHVKELLRREFPATSEALMPSPLSNHTLEARLLSKIHPTTSSVSDIDRYFNDPLAQVTEESVRDLH